MSETFFHLLGPGTQPNDDSFSMNPLPITCQVMMNRVWRPWSNVLTARR